MLTCTTAGHSEQGDFNKSFRPGDTRPKPVQPPLHVTPHTAVLQTFNYDDPAKAFLRALVEAIFTSGLSDRADGFITTVLCPVLQE